MPAREEIHELSRGRIYVSVRNYLMKGQAASTESD